MTKASDNDYPSILLTEQGSAPTTPAASHQRLYIRTSDHTLVTVNSSGTVAPVSAAAGAASAHGARVHRASTNFSIGNNTSTAVQFDAEDYDTDTIHDNSTGNTKLTIPSISGVTTGLWTIKCSGYTTGGGTLNYIVFRIAGTTLIAFVENNDGVLGTYQLSTDYVFTAGDYVECMVKTPGGTGSVVHDPGISPLFSIAFLGKVT